MLKYKNIGLLFICSFLGMTTLAQKGAQSPYSSIGLGELNSEGYALFSSMGGVALANSDSSIVNSYNPASYSFIARNMPVFQIGLNGKASVLVQILRLLTNVILA